MTDADGLVPKVRKLIADQGRLREAASLLGCATYEVYDRVQDLLDRKPERGLQEAALLLGCDEVDVGDRIADLIDDQHRLRADLGSKINELKGEVEYLEDKIAWLESSR